VYVNPDRHGENLHQDAQALLVDFRNRADLIEVSTAGDPILLNSRFDRVTPTSITSSFGEEFAQAIIALPTGEWQGPVRSGYGLHLVFIYERQDSSMPDYNTIRDKVRENLMKERRGDAANSLYESLRERYHLVVERPRSAATPPSSQTQ